jgi:hypothetical protein
VAVAVIQLPSLEKPKFSAGPRDNPVLFLIPIVNKATFLKGMLILSEVKL